MKTPENCSDKFEEEGKSFLDDAEDKDKGLHKRETWSSRLDFLLACVGFSVGFGNVWRFPYLCYKNGGGAFLIPYLICVVVAGVPLFFLEVTVGQFMGVSGFKAWNICPLLQGLGGTTTTIVFFLNCYYNVIICWAIYYVFSSFTSELPWKTCGHEWNTEHCYDFNGVNKTEAFATNLTVTTVNTSLNYITPNNISSPVIRIDPVNEFWERKVLGLSSGIDEMGTVRWDLALCLLLAWVIVYVCICKGIRTSGKVMYVTATAPYFFMLALLIRNSVLEGALDGVIYYLKPDLTKLGDMEVWIDASTQIMWSYSIGNGALTALGSYNKFNHNSYRDVTIFAFINSGTSIFAGFLIFTILGHMAFLQDTTIDKVAASGPGLAFIAYPKAVSMMPGAPVWSALFFIMIIFLGIDSQFVQMEGFITPVVDQYAHILRRGYRKEIFIAVVCAVSYLIGLSMIAEGGMYVFQIFDYYSGNRVILLVAFAECVAVSWIYGINRIYDNIEMMLGHRISRYMWLAWTVLTPLFCIVFFLISIVTYSELDYKRPTMTYQYPDWAVAIGWIMAMSSAVWIPALIIHKFFKYGFTMETLRLMMVPIGLKNHQLRPEDKGEKSLNDLNSQT
ncbi:sodium- and chloride-dependent creatine transporter 1-like [Mizuhopecten yessoensis]|uniref:Transporter n=1 Tax=Mizuhopecten yessoensis TaxID=6573 RepID=A0A210R334_MIZYE|nr:sodium- and chloride-dependent creatine transporter 1-like [Mizuhopecten yessoensis]OWF55397.1 Sodium- and chloride-dependent GABA transporter 3 [Mizuhopecten yessoensis]